MTTSFSPLAMFVQIQANIIMLGVYKYMTNDLEFKLKM